MEKRQGQGMIEVMEGRQIQRLSPQQIMLAELIEKPIAALEEEIRKKLDENIALEENREDEHPDGFDQSDEAEQGEKDDDRYSYSEEIEERRQEEDELPVYAPQSGGGTSGLFDSGEANSFLHDLETQISEHNLDQDQTFLVKYLIGCLDNRGFIDQPISSIVDDLLFNEYVTTDEAHLEEAIAILQQFEPIGIGARNEQECLLIQLKHKLEENENVNENENPNADHLSVLQTAHDIISHHYDRFLTNDHQQLAAVMQLPIEQIEQALEQIRRLNPRPGRALSESANEQAATVIPDVVMETDEGSIVFYLNNENLPHLQVCNEYVNMVRQMDTRKDHLSKSDREGYEYTKRMVGEATTFIYALNERHKTMQKVAKALIHLQREFILSQDEADLHPITLRDVSQRTQLDVSTISRVKNNKYVAVDGTVFKMDVFFPRVHKNSSGEELQHKQIKQRIGEIIQHENKAMPYSDQQIESILRSEGHNISRRTINKYREEMGLPSARERQVSSKQ